MLCSAAPVSGDSSHEDEADRGSDGGCSRLCNLSREIRDK